jgi:predicted enzyme related to lactoylglutathione lyase
LKVYTLKGDNTFAKHKLVHFEVPVNNSKEAGEFYSSVFDWQMQYMEQFDYTTFSTGPETGGGFITIGNPNNPAKVGDVLVYISTDDIDATLAQVEKSGGKTVDPKMEIPGVGWMAVFTDPTGNRIGLFTGLPHTT